MSEAIQIEPSQFRNAWPIEHDNVLKEMWGKGYTAGMIGKELCRTRNSIIGRAHRLELPRVRGAIGTSQARQARIKRDTKRMARVVVVRKPKFRIVKPEAPPPAVEPVSLRVPFLSRKPFQCSWIAGDPHVDMTCCGHKTKVGSSYCRFHHARVWIKPEKRVR